jgi:hypothetical protein
MAITAPAADDTVKVVDQSSEYRNKTGTVISVDETTQYLMVQLSDSHKKVRLRLTQIKVIGSAGGGSVTLNSGNNPGGTIAFASHASYTPKNNQRRDVLGAGYNPHESTGTLNDTRPGSAIQ